MKVESKSKYKVSLAADEALAFYECFVLHGLAATSFEGNVLNKVIADIDKEFAINASIEIVEKKEYINKF